MIQYLWLNQCSIYDIIRKAISKDNGNYYIVSYLLCGDFT